MYVLREILILLWDWLNKRPALRNALLATMSIVLLSVAWGVVRWLTSDVPVRFAVSGGVLLAGAPLDAGMIEFRPVAVAGGGVGGAAIRDGRYRIAGDRGLLAGEYDVRIFSAALPQERPENEPPGRGLPPGVERIPPEFGAQTRQRVTVGRGRRNVFDFDVPAHVEPPVAAVARPRR